MKKIPIRKAVAQNCKDCIYDPLAGGTHLRQIEDCTMTHCALYLHRPLTSLTQKAKLEEKVKGMSEGQLDKYVCENALLRHRLTKMG